MTTDQIKRLLDFDTPTIANGIELLAHRDPTVGYSGPDVRALMPDLGRRVGVAVTARMDTTSAGVDNPESLFAAWLRAMQETAGDQMLPIFAVIESVGPRPRSTVTIGDGMATVMMMAGVTGFITNGSIRDIEGVRGVGLPCWGAGTSPMHGRLRWLDVQSPVVIDGMTVRPGDLIHADVNGAVVISHEIAGAVYDKAAEVRDTEARIFASLRAPGMNLERYLAERA